MRDFSPIINRLRTGSAIDPYVEKVEYLTVKNSILFLAELPSKFDGVIISGYSEVSEDTLQTIGLLDANQYVVDYKNGSIYFNSSENNKQVTIAYKGRGIAMTPADRIYYSEGGVVKSLEDLIADAVDKTTEAADAITYAKVQGDYAKAQGEFANQKATLADQKATLADTAASNANTEGTYAKNQGDFAKTQGENAQTKANEAVTATNQAVLAKDDAITATTNANQATQNANDKALFAQSQGDYAKQEGDATKLATSDFELVKASVLQAKSDTEEATDIALTSATNADTKAILADSKATLANEKATLADQKAALAQEKADLADVSAVNADTKAALADDKATLADTKAALAQSKADYAQTQGEYAKSQGDIARNESSNLSILKTDVTNATTLANSKAQEADTQAQYAKTQGDYAKEQGDLAREALEAGGVSVVNGKSGVVTLTPTDIGTMSIADIDAAVNFAKLEAEAYADEKISEVISSAPETLDTLNELAQALGDDPNFATTVSNQIGLKVDQLAFDLHKNDGSIHPTPAKQAEWDNKIPKSEKGAPNGVPTLDANGKVPQSQLNISSPSDATTSVKGIVQLEDSVSSVSIVKAATPNSVKQAYDLANGAIQSSQKGIASGVATLGADGKIPSTQLNVTQPADATTSVKGIVMLDDTVNSSSTTKAATANSVKNISDQLNTFTGKKVHEQEVHGLRYVGEKLEVFNGSTWIKVTSEIPVAEVTNFTASTKADGTGVNLSWVNPSNSEYTKTLIYASSSDLSGAKYDYVKENATEIVNSNILTSFVQAAAHNQVIYLKAFAQHNVFGNQMFSEGISINVRCVDSVAPGTVLELAAQTDDQRVILSWMKPADADLNKVRIVYKTGSYPNSSTDGLIGYEGLANTTTIVRLTNDTRYYFRLFTYDNAGNVNSTTLGQQIEAVPSLVKIYGVLIDKANSNPLTSVTYTDNAVGMNAGSDWDTVYPFNKIRPVLFNAGTVIVELDKNDFTKDINGNIVDIASGNAGDVMIEVPKFWWKFETINGKLAVRYADKKIDSTWVCPAHTKAGVEKDKIYIGAYLGNVISSRLRSLSGKTPTTNQTIGSFRTLANANGIGYQQESYTLRLMLQILCLMRGKSLDTQTSFGGGYVEMNGAKTATGGTNLKSMYFGEATGKQQMKFSGIEDVWGNCSTWLDGLYIDGSRNMLIGDNNFNDTGSGYINYGSFSVSNIGGYINDVQSGNVTGFIPKAVSGSSTTYYTDSGYVSSGFLPVAGAYWNNGSTAGVFRLDVRFSANNTGSDISSRLCFV